MYQSSEQQDSNYLNKYISASSPKFRSSNNPLMKQIKNFIKLQQSRFGQISEGCTFLEQCITSIESMIDHIQQKINEINQFRQSQTISNLKNKQNEFIINQLKQKIKKYEKNQQNLQIQLKHLKKQLENIKRQSNLQSTTNVNQIKNYKDQLNQLNSSLKQKDEMIEVLNQKIVKLIGQRKQQSKKQATNQKQKLKSKQRQKEGQYKILEGKLLELQKQFDIKMGSLHKQLMEKTERIEELERELKDKEKKIEKFQSHQSSELKNTNLNDHQNYNEPINANSSSLTFTFHPSKKMTPPPPPPQLYELELKLTQQQKLCKELQTQYNAYLTSSNNTEIQLHQQIHQQKLLIQDEKKKNRNQKKKFIQQLQSLASFINKRNFNYFQSNQSSTIIQEIKKIFAKEKQKMERELNQYKKIQSEQKQRISQAQRQLRRLRSDNQSLKQQVQQSKQQLEKLMIQKQKQKKQLQKKQSSSIAMSNRQSTVQKRQKPSLNGSFGQISNTNSKSQTPSAHEQKYKEIIQSLRHQLKQKQTQITQLQVLQSKDFEKSKVKILKIEEELADSRNQLKKIERQKRQLVERIEQLNREVQNFKNLLAQIKQKTHKEKQAYKQQYEQKQKLMEQKLSKIKEQNQTLDAKCQQKVMKYNKLKSKVEKLEMYNSQTQKRKDTQIQQLIKKNQQLKIDCKLIEQKLNIIQINNPTNEGSEFGSTTKQDNGGYNKDLIQQIQMQRDRILQQYQTKRRQYLKMKQQNEKLQEQKFKLQQQKLKLSSQQQKLTSQIQRLNDQLQKQLSNRTSLEQQISQLKVKVQQLSKQLQQSAQKCEKQKQLLEKQKQQNQNRSKQQYQHLKKELETQLTVRKKLQKQQLPLVQRIKQLKEENEKLRKQAHEKQQKQVQIRRQMQSRLETRYLQKLKEKSHHHHEEINRIKLEQESKAKDYEEKLVQAKIREESLVTIINYKNQQTNGEVRDSMKGEEDMGIDREELQKQVQNIVKSLPQENTNPLKNYQEVQSEQEEHNALKIEKIHQETNTQSLFSKSNLTLQKLNNVNIPSSPRLHNLFYQKIIQLVIIPQKVLANNDKFNPNSSNFKKTNSVMFNDQETNCNIFLNQNQLFDTLKSSFPQTLDKLNILINPNLIEQKQLKPFILETISIGINTDKQINSLYVQNQKGQIPSKNAIKQHKKQPLFILQNQLLGSYHQSDEGQNNIEQENNHINKGIHQQNDQFLLIEQEQPISISPRNKKIYNPHQNRVQQINLFQNLKPPNKNDNFELNGQQNIDDNFEICQQGQSINIGQTALNLQIKQIFNKLREQLQKVFNGQQISLSMIKILPRQLQDDYSELIAYIRQKIEQIKKENQLSFIMAEVGDSPEEVQQQLDKQLRNFMDKKISQDIFTYKKLVEEKEALLTSLMNEKTMQQNTINQMTMERQELDQQHQNRFMNQCTIYKKQIKELKNKLDQLQMNFQSLKNVFKNVMQIWVDEMENQDDLRDNFAIYKKVGKLSQLQSTRLNYYIFRYKEIKNITDQ